MSISVTVKKNDKLEVEESLKEFVKQELGKIINKYELHYSDADVVFSSTHADLFVVDITLNLSNDFSIHCQETNYDSLSPDDRDPVVVRHHLEFKNEKARYCVANALRKLENQITKYKNRLRTKKRGHHTSLLPKYVISSEDSEADDFSGENPAIIAQMEIPLVHMSVADAAIKLDLSKDPVLVFVNSKHGGINVVYKRNDNNIGWIDPTLALSLEDGAQ